MSCDVCGAQDGQTRWCETCGVDYCESCALGAHDMMHEISMAGQARAEEWLR